MTTFVFFLDFNYGRRRPAMDFRLNGQPCAAETVWSGGYHDNTEHVIMQFDTDTTEHNILEIEMHDKTDQDLVFSESGMIDHFVEIMDIEIGGIRMDLLLYKTGEFRHSMSDQWVQDMQSRDIMIEPCYHGSTQLRLNGVWSLQFDMPFWRWCAERS